MDRDNFIPKVVGVVGLTPAESRRVRGGSASNLLNALNNYRGVLQNGYSTTTAYQWSGIGYVNTSGGYS